MFRVFQYVKIHHRHGIHKKPQLRHQIGAFRDGLPCFFLRTVSLCYRCEWFAKVWYAKKEFLWGLSVLYVKYQMKTYKKKTSTFAHKCFFSQCPLNTLHLGLEYRHPSKVQNDMLFNQSRLWIVSFPPLDGLNKEQTRDYSDHDFQVLVVHRQFLTTQQMDTNGALVRANLKLMMIHQSVSPYIKYTSLILFEVIVEADVWICFGKVLDFWSISVTISVVFF